MLELLKQSVADWARHRAASKGAALALYMVFSLAPMLVLVIALAGLFYSESTVKSELMSQLQDLFGQNGAQAVQAVMASAHNSKGGWLAALISIGVVMFSATSAFSELKSSLDELWEVKSSDTSGIEQMVRSRVLSFGLVLVLAAFLLVSLALNAALGAARGFYGALWTYTSFTLIASWISSLFSFAILVILFAVVYKILPSAPIRWRNVIPGAVVTAALFVLGKWGIGVYLSRGAVVSAYGAAGSLIAVLLWIYYSAQIFFFGAVFTRQYALMMEKLDPVEGEAPAVGTPGGPGDAHAEEAPDTTSETAADEPAARAAARIGAAPQSEPGRGTSRQD